MKNLLIIGILALILGSSISFAGQEDCPDGWYWREGANECVPPSKGSIRG
jgi:hypothetical protein